MHGWETSSSFAAVGLVGRAAILALEGLFVAGIIGSAIVVIITFIEDFEEVFSKDEPSPRHAAVREDVHG